LLTRKSSNKISRDGARALALFLESDPILEHLELSNNRVQDAGAISLARALRSNSHLR
jgi:hypothetical protein